MLDRQTSGTHASLRSDRAHWSLEGERLYEDVKVETDEKPVSLSPKAKTKHQEARPGWLESV